MPLEEDSEAHSEPVGSCATMEKQRPPWALRGAGGMGLVTGRYESQLLQRLPSEKSFMSIWTLLVIK